MQLEAQKSRNGGNVHREGKKYQSNTMLENKSTINYCEILHHIITVIIFQYCANIINKNENLSCDNNYLLAINYFNCSNYYRKICTITVNIFEWQ
jgi:hypothetical protein